ncbi:hypothetical protein ACFX2J_004132 [Malus domestica]
MNANFQEILARIARTIPPLRSSTISEISPPSSVHLDSRGMRKKKKEKNSRTTGCKAETLQCETDCTKLQAYN